ncbi:Na(+)/H(+) antiporter subunit F1 [Desulforamulus aeronauticus]|uniref:Multisubunit sodium/proton antiporter, MrpF subunit (TC 2.A.63.1) n=1 Tax=Desulforamulus aeronauticus DSM 10349 TaxID=1121421 RepID=A0A1M6NP87_9FIRM|nr:Na(+)/H(+) antiporter subunit F1 [Desulforamulus aeronauticus]SHJ97529.1 multisubunit sodium/proton antiporter, MrpF subunit (TC 2.A.63.1) [Desulforamulus aeronauticus DSM 10349]
MFERILLIALFFLTVSILVGLYRVIKGPSLPDRVVALDTIGINIIAGVAIFSILLNTHAFFDIILLIGILSFIGTISFSKFIERGYIIEYKRDC